MSALICRNCRASRQTLFQHSLSSTRTYSSQSSPTEPQEPPKPKKKRPKDYKPPTNIETYLNEPRSLRKPNFLPGNEQGLKKLRLEPKQLHHLLRLSALPMPSSPAEEEKMLDILALQLQFVKNMRKVNTDGVEPLQSIRDETTEGREEATIGLEALKDALGKEEVKGRSRRPRRRREVVDTKGVEDWDVLGTASEKLETPAGRYFVVRSGKEKEAGNE